MFDLELGELKDKNTKDRIEKNMCPTKDRPWIRYFARFIDISLAGILINVFQLLFFHNEVFDYRVTGFLSLIIWMFIESQMLSSWGYTPGKWLLRVKVRDIYDNKLNFQTALKRSFLVWTIGLGLGVFSMITLIISYNQLERTGKTSWDRQCSTEIIYEKIGIIRTGFAFLYLVIFIAQLFYL